jgi:hypothetical protein
MVESSAQRLDVVAKMIPVKLLLAEVGLTGS